MDRQQRENRRMRAPHRSTYLYGPLSFTTSWGKEYLKPLRGREESSKGRRTSGRHLPDDGDQWSELLYVEEAVRRNGHSRKQDSAKGKITAEDSYAQATVLFANIVGFTSLPRTEIILFLNGLFTRFDIAATRHGIEKIKTIADGYMAA